MVRDPVRPPAAPRAGAGEGQRHLGDLLDSQRLRPRAARADPRRPAQRADRPGPEPPAGQHRHRGRAARATSTDAGRDRRRRRTRRSRAGGPAARRGGGGDARRRRGQPLDAGAGVVKALHPFCKLGGRHRTFLEVHLAKSRRTGAPGGRRPCRTSSPPATSRTTPSTSATSTQSGNYGYPGDCSSRRGGASGCAWCRWPATCASPGRRCRSRCSTSRPRRCARACTRAHRLGPGGRGGQRLHRQRPARSACTRWATGTRCRTCCATASWPASCAERPQLKYLLLHNIDTLGLDLDPALLGLHIRQGATPDLRGDHAGASKTAAAGLARVDGQLRLVEGLAMPREEDEFRLSYYNSN